MIACLVVSTTVTFAPVLNAIGWQSTLAYARRITPSSGEGNRSIRSVTELRSSHVAVLNALGRPGIRGFVDNI